MIPGEHMMLPDASDTLLRVVASRYAESQRSLLVKALWLAEARDGLDRSALRARAEALSWPVFPLSGQDILNAPWVPPVKPGPLVGRLLRCAKGHWLAHGCIHTREQLLEEIRVRLYGDSSTP